MNQPANPKAAEARAAIMEHEAQFRDMRQITIGYHLTWPAKQLGVCCVGGQWQRNGVGEIGAAYTADQLQFAVNIMSHILRQS